MRVRVTSDVHPIRSHPFAKMRAGQQFIHRRTVWVWLLLPSAHLFRGRRQSREVQARATKQLIKRSSWTRRQFFFLQSGENKVVDSISWPSRVAHLRKLRANRRDK